MCVCSYSFADCVQYDKIMTAHIARMLKKGTEDGYPKLKAEDDVPSSRSLYQANPLRQAKPESTQAHPVLSFLRAWPVNLTLEILRNRGFYPVQVKGSGMPNGKKWNNFAQFLYTFHAIYCDAEGLSRTQTLARQILLYLFYGTWSSSKR